MARSIRPAHSTERAGLRRIDVILGELRPEPAALDRAVTEARTLIQARVADAALRGSGTGE
ncbi:hypothetical protein ACFV0T_25695 [Streptomyces sp. NPDC059582]|uniref:hypothetical protein n=1 Tax=Streptomyces sp. NPDC059582 TaxID=3346875 RepID=UPI003695C2DA